MSEVEFNHARQKARVIIPKFLTECQMGLLWAEQRITALERENAKLNCMCEYAELALSDLGGERDQLDKENERLLSLGNKSLNSGIETHAENILLRKRITALEKVIDAVIELMEAPPFHVGDYDTIKTAMRAAGYLEGVEL